MLRDVSFDMLHGEIVSIVGPNGSGKTTLLQTVLALLRPTAGAIQIGGHSVFAMSTRDRARLMAYVPQRLEQSPAFSVRDVVATGRFALDDPAKDESAIAAALETCGITPLAEQRFDRLSGGERQKVLIAAAIAQAPLLLCLDEPNTALDPAYQIELVRILRRCHADGRALLVVSHDLNLPAVLGGRVVALRDGRVIADAAASDVLRADRLRLIYDAEFDVVDAPGGGRLVTPRWWQAP